jgi:hypothetical protein
LYRTKRQAIEEEAGAIAGEIVALTREMPPGSAHPPNPLALSIVTDPSSALTGLKKSNLTFPGLINAPTPGAAAASVTSIKPRSLKLLMQVLSPPGHRALLEKYRNVLLSVA